VRFDWKCLIKQFNSLNTVSIYFNPLKAIAMATAGSDLVFSDILAAEIATVLD